MSSSLTPAKRKRELDPTATSDDALPPPKRQKTSTTVSEEETKIRQQILEDIDHYDKYIESNEMQKNGIMFKETDAPQNMITSSECKLCNETFAASTGKKGPVSTSKSHQKNLLKHYIDAQLAFPSHIELKSIQIKPNKLKDRLYR